ncbi:MAG: VWA domain-containing protein [Thiocapsa sp. C3-sup]
MTSDLDAVAFAVNPEPRCACLLVLDVSGSMEGERIDALNEGLQVFQDALRQDELAAKRVEVGILSFGDSVRIVQDFVTADEFVAPTLVADGVTPMGEAVEQGLDMIEARKRVYDANGIAFSSTVPGSS